MLVHTYPTIFENRDFFRFSLLSTRKRRSWHHKHSFSKTIPRMEFCEYLNLDPSFNCMWTDENSMIDVIHHILLALRILCRGCYRTSIVLAFSSAFCFVSFQVFLINSNHFTGFLILLFCVERPLAIMLCSVLLLLIPLCFANDEISNDEVSGFINKFKELQTSFLWCLAGS